jgi:hypothetical protein
VEAELSVALTNRDAYAFVFVLALEAACAGLVRADYANVSAIPELDCFFAEPITRDHCAHCALSQPHAAAPHPPVTWSDVARQYGVEVAAPPAAAPTVAPVAVTVPADALPTDEDELLARVGDARVAGCTRHRRTATAGTSSRSRGAVAGGKPGGSVECGAPYVSAAVCMAVWWSGRQLATHGACSVVPA